MKRCPECRRDYYDETLLYCLDDGTQLLDGPASVDEPATAVYSNPHDTEAERTRTFEDASTAAIQPTTGKRKFLIAGAVGVLVLTAFGIGAFWYYGRSETQITSIAVMPFVNASGNAEIEYISDGMTESLMNSLSQLPNLSVKARSSVFRYKGKEIEPVAVARELGVQAVLNGRIVQRGEQLTLSLDLVDARAGNQIWGENYNRKLGDLAALQTAIARDVSQKLRQRLTGAQENSVTKNQTQNSDAYQLYLQGRYHWNKRTDSATNKAIEYFQKAIEKDPQYAMAYVGLAESYVTGDMLNRDAAPKIAEAATKALEIDPTLGEPHAALATIKDGNEYDWTGAEKEYRRAIELSPNYATAYHWLAESLAMQGRFDESFSEYKRALEIDPLSLAIGTDLGMAYYYSRQYDRAIDHLKKLIEMDPNYVRTHFYLARVYEEKRMFEEATQEIKKGAVLEGEDPVEFDKGKRKVLDAYKASGGRGYWQQILEFHKEAIRTGKSPHRLDMARLYARLGERDEALAWLEKVFDIGEAAVVWLKVSPEWDNLRGDPRFSELLKKVGLQH
jgi:TolB-like protein/Tfp pilus assembly protein PilF